MKNQFDSLEQRIIGSFYLTLPSFYPEDNTKVTKEEQYALYEFVKSIFKRLYNEPTLIFKNLKEDFGFLNTFTAAGSDKPEMQDVMRKEYREIQGIIQNIMDIGLNGTFNGEEVIYEGKIPGKVKNLFILSGLEFNGNIIKNLNKPFFNALTWFVKKPGMSIRRFSTLSFADHHDYLREILATACSSEDGACDLVIDHLLQKGYQPCFACTKYPKPDEYMVSYIKNINGLVEPVGFPYMGDSVHLGFSLEYRYMGKNPCFCTIRVQNFKGILRDFDKLNHNMQAFIIRKTKKCDGCRYCVQTDKTHLRPKAFFLVDFEGKQYPLCPLYPGFTFSFVSIDKTTAQDIIAFLDLIEDYNLKHE